MEDALAPTQCLPARNLVVLILVLMEDALAPSVEMAQAVCVDLVLILVLMEDALAPRNGFACKV